MAGPARPTRVIACFGDRCVEAGLREQIQGPNVDPSVVIELGGGALLREPVDFAAVLHVFAAGSVAQPARQTFSGFVRAMQVEGELCLVRASSMATWEERTIRGLTIRNHQAPEIILLVARLAGVPEANIKLHGWHPPSEPMLVVMPIEGLKWDRELQAGPVGFTPDPEAAGRFDTLDNAGLQADFREPGMWAVTSVTTNTLYHAEQFGVAAIERALGRVALAARYSFSATPRRNVRAFKRERALEQVQLRRIAGVEGLRTGRMWLHALDDDPAQHPLDDKVLDGLEGELGADDSRVDEALVAWRRAITTRHGDAAVVALAEALEWYAGETKVGRLFSRTELRDIRTNALQSFSESDSDPVKRDRIGKILGQLNSPPFQTRLRAALQQDQVPITTGEFELLERFRELRDKVIHGQSRTTPTEEDLRHAIALVDRLLVFRLTRRAPKATPAPARPR